MLLFKLQTSKEGNSKQHFKKYTPIQCRPVKLLNVLDFYLYVSVFSV